MFAVEMFWFHRNVNGVCVCVCVCVCVRTRARARVCVSEICQLCS